MLNCHANTKAAKDRVDDISVTDMSCTDLSYESLK